MLDLKSYVGPYGIPIYHQQMPEMVGAVSMAWVMHTGSADDLSVGSPGLYHWFEHVPFRGTCKYPRGTPDIRRPIARMGGRVGAYTTQNMTVFHVNLPVRKWKHGLSVITDLMAQPLLLEENVSAERDIIRQEIAKKKSSADKFMSYSLGEILWKGHAFGHPVLGNEETLDSMDASIMKQAHRKGYDRSRASLFLVGNVPLSELLFEVEQLGASIPSNGLSTRLYPEYFGPLPEWKAGATTRIETEFSSSTIMLLFPLSPQAQIEENFAKANLFTKLFGWGGGASPLFQIVREERHLVYGTQSHRGVVPGGGTFGFHAESKRENIEAVLQAFHDTLNSALAYSQERIDEIIEGMSGMMEMQSIDTHELLDRGINHLTYQHRMVSDSEYCDSIKGYTVSMAKQLIEGLDLAQAHTVIFEGKSRS